MKRNLPPFAAIRAFEAAAKHENFKKAAEEINLSASAISHQVRSLEDYLKVSLFHRKNGSVKLTNKGNAYYHHIVKIINDLEKATLEVGVHRNINRLVINLDHSLLSCWLEYSIQNFRDQYPDAEIEFISTEHQPDPNVDFDLAIYFSQEPIHSENTYHLLSDYLTLVAAPDLAKTLSSQPDIDELKSLTFLHCSSDETEWEKWFSSFNLSAPTNMIKLTTNHRAVVLNSAEMGTGVALGRQPYLEQYLRRKSLLRPYSDNIATGYNYYLTVSNTSQHLPIVRDFVAWIQKQVRTLTRIHQ
jgi:LysR family glycine cleavage system transcriptional activator